MMIDDTRNESHYRDRREELELLEVGPNDEVEPLLERASDVIQVFSYHELGVWCSLFGRASGVKPPKLRPGEPLPYDPESPEYLEQIAQDEIGLFVIAGPPGTGKSKHMKSAVQDGTLYVEGGRMSPLGLYIALHPHRFDQKIVIDDAETILKEPDGRNLAKGICQTTRVKTISWRTMSKALKEASVPQSYQLTASLGVVTNDLDLLKDKRLGPLLSRGVLIMFTPSKYEIHAQTKLWFLKGEDDLSRTIYDFVDERLDRIAALDMRLYYTARVIAFRGGDWEAFLKERLLGWGSEELLAERLMLDTKYSTIEDRYSDFRRRTGKSRSHFNKIITQRGLRSKKVNTLTSETSTEPFAEPSPRVDFNRFLGLGMDALPLVAARCSDVGHLASGADPSPGVIRECEQRLHDAVEKSEDQSWDIGNDSADTPGGSEGEVDGHGVDLSVVPGLTAARSDAELQFKSVLKDEELERGDGSGEVGAIVLGEPVEPDHEETSQRRGQRRRKVRS